MSGYYRAWQSGKELSDDVESNLLLYFRKNKEKFVVIDRYIFDLSSLSSKINLSICSNCANYLHFDCCKGNNRSLDEESRTSLNVVSDTIINSIGGDVLDSYYRYGLYTKSGSITSRGRNDGRCVFSLRTEKCCIDRYCESHNIDCLKVKPKICSLFPIEGITLTSGFIFVFCGCSDTSLFSCYNWRILRLPCINYNNAYRLDSGDYGNSKYLHKLSLSTFKEYNNLSRYRYSYIEKEVELRYILGDSVYEGLVCKFDDC